MEREVVHKVEPTLSMSVSPPQRSQGFGIRGYWHNTGADTDISLPRKEDKLQGSVHDCLFFKNRAPRLCMSYGDRSFGTACFSTADVPLNYCLYYITWHLGYIAVGIYLFQTV